ncbi:hypothetical protein DKQ62_04605 [Halomonas elongata]|nr:hypothetical protein DKQ62_04605 [Halomonas elongata]
MQFWYALLLENDTVFAQATITWLAPRLSLLVLGVQEQAMKRSQIKKRPMSDTTLAQLESEATNIGGKTTSAYEARGNSP